MNVYDFDGTIYDGDSTVDFYFFCLKHRKKILRALPIQIGAIFKYELRFISKTKLKENFFSFLKYLNDTNELIVSFAKLNKHKIKSWYLKQKEDDDVIISASPEFIVKEICNMYDIKNVIASKVNYKTGEFISQNCWGSEKINRFRNIYSLESINNFYSDSKSDEPMARCAKNSFYVKNKNIIPWD